MIPTWWRTQAGALALAGLRKHVESLRADNPLSVQASASERFARRAARDIYLYIFARLLRSQFGETLLEGERERERERETRARRRRARLGEALFVLVSSSTRAYCA